MGAIGRNEARQNVCLLNYIEINTTHKFFGLLGAQGRIFKLLSLQTASADFITLRCGEILNLQTKIVSSGQGFIQIFNVSINLRYQVVDC
jgi:hypothetical protein